MTLKNFLKNKKTFLPLHKFSLFLILILLNFLVSCHQTSIFNYLEENTNKISVSEVTSSAEFPLDNEGYLSLPSNQEVELKYLIKNPSGYEISYDYTLPSSTQTALDTLLADGTISSDSSYSTKMEDAFAVTLVLPQDFLYQLERSSEDGAGSGCDFSGTLQLYAADYSYLGQSQIDSFTKRIRINSAPPQVLGAAIMVDGGNSTSSSIGTYVLCFNLPDSIFEKKGIHRDLEKIKITGLASQTDLISASKRYSEGIDLEISESADESGVYTYNDYLPVKPSTSLELSRIEYNNVQTYGFPAVEFVPGNYPVYISDSTAYASKNDSRTYTITLYDEYGLSSSVTVNTLYAQLKPVKAKTHKTYYKSDEDLAELNEQSAESGSSETYAEYTSVSFTESDQEAGFLNFNLEAPNGLVGGTLNGITDAEIFYSIYSLDMLAVLPSEITSDWQKNWINHKNVQFMESKSSSPKILELEDHHIYKVVAYAHKDGYLDSNPQTWTVFSGDWRFVDVTIGDASYNVLLSLSQNLAEDGFPESFVFTVKFYDENFNYVEEDFNSSPYSDLSQMTLEVFDTSGGPAVDTLSKTFDSADEEKSASLTYTLDSTWKLAAQENGGSLPIYFTLSAQIDSSEYTDAKEFTLSIPEDSGD